MSGIIYTPPAGAGVTPDLDQVMTVGNSTTQNYVGTGISLNTFTVVTGSYAPTPDDFLLLVDASTGNVNINVPITFFGILAVKLINYTPGNVVRVRIDPPGTIDGAGQYTLTRQHGSIIIGKKNATDFVVLANNDGLGSVNSGVYVDPAFTGGTITIPHTFNAIPQGISIEPGNAATANIIGGPYWISRTASNIIINLPVVVVVPTSIEIFWSVTRN
jgi:hypothetical protein